MSMDLGIKPVVVNGETIEKLPEPTWLDWVKYYVYNAFRKPLVWKRKRELIRLFEEVKESMDLTLLPLIWEKRFVCNACHDAYMILKPQVFMSQLEMALRFMGRDEDHIHKNLYLNFWGNNLGKFKRSEELAAWINGFSK